MGTRSFIHQVLIEPCSAWGNNKGATLTLEQAGEVNSTYSQLGRETVVVAATASQKKGQLLWA